MTTCRFSCDSCDTYFESYSIKVNVGPERSALFDQSLKNQLFLCKDCMAAVLDSVLIDMRSSDDSELEVGEMVQFKNYEDEWIFGQIDEVRRSPFTNQVSYHSNELGTFSKRRTRRIEC